MTNKKVMVLIVDQNEKTASDLQQSFDPKTYLIDVAKDGFEAIRKINDKKYSAILFDINLPKMDGIQLAGYIKANSLNRDTHLFLMAKNASEEIFAKLVKISFAKLIRQPPIPSEVVKLLEATLSNNYPENYDPKITTIFSEAASEIVQYYFGQEPSLGELTVRGDTWAHSCTLTGLIPLFGKSLFGSISISCQSEFVELLCLKVFADRKVELTDDLRADLLRELINQLAGCAKRKFKSIGIFTAIGLPEAIIGENHKVLHKVSNPILLRPVTVKGTTCYLEMCLGREIEEVADKDEDIQFL